MSRGRWLRPGVTSGSGAGGPTVDQETMMQPWPGLDELRTQGRMPWVDGEPLGGNALSSLERDPYEDDGGES